MREIKFRQWCEDDKKFYYWGVNIGGAIFTSPTIAGGCMLKTPHEQYTGLKDVNGVEIYEGDIVKVRCISRPIREVKWNNERAIFMFCAPGKLSHPGLKYNGFGCDVIGNIHENTELLEVE